MNTSEPTVSIRPRHYGHIALHWLLQAKACALLNDWEQAAHFMGQAGMELYQGTYLDYDDYRQYAEKRMALGVSIDRIWDTFLLFSGFREAGETRE